MNKLLVVVGLLALGAVGWHLYGESVTNKVDEFRANVQSQIEHAVDAQTPKH